MWAKFEPALGQRLAWVCSAALCIGAGYTFMYSLVFDDWSCKYKKDSVVVFIGACWTLLIEA